MNHRSSEYIFLTGVLIWLPSCNGILGDIYDEPPVQKQAVMAGSLFIDASEWDKWHYIDLKQINDSTLNDQSDLWQTYRIPISRDVTDIHPQAETTGIYSYWYDVFGAGLSNHEFRGFAPTDSQPEPETWTFAVHRNNIRTNGGAACETRYLSVDELPEGTQWLEELDFVPDTWNEKDVWTIQDNMLSGIIGNQGIRINEVLGAWLTVEIPPMPPLFRHNPSVFILRLSDGSYAALQLVDYMDSKGTKCNLTIKYRYPL